jgi:hypothetical protein
MDFSDALKELRNGKALRRKGWNAANQYVYLVPQASYPAQTDVAKAEFGDSVPYGPYLAIKTVQGTVVPWLASQTDLLNDDWEVKE